MLALGAGGNDEGMHELGGTPLGADMNEEMGAGAADVAESEDMDRRAKGGAGPVVDMGDDRAVLSPEL